jgi:hypothetical protein
MQRSCPSMLAGAHEGGQVGKAVQACKVHVSSRSSQLQQVSVGERTERCEDQENLWASCCFYEGCRGLLLCQSPAKNLLRLDDMMR